MSDKEKLTKKQRINQGQLAISESADFEQGTWTFQMLGDFAVRAGKFIVIPEEQYHQAKLSETNQRHEERMKELVKEAFSAGISMGNAMASGEPTDGLTFGDYWNENYGSDE